MENIYAFTGHRPQKLGGYGDVVEHRLLALALSFLFESRPDTAIVGMALGWDMAVAEACVRLEIPFIAAIPCFGQESRWPVGSVIRYKELLTRAKERRYISTEAYSPKLMHKRNEWMVNEATKLIALWDGAANGGTYQCVMYASSKGKPVENLWPRWLAIKP